MIILKKYMKLSIPGFIYIYFILSVFFKRLLFLYSFLEKISLFEVIKKHLFDKVLIILLTEVIGPPEPILGKYE